MYKLVMALVIYVDVLLVVNLYINYFLIRGTALVLRRNTAPVRIIAAAGVGAAGSLMILAPDIHPAICVVIRLCFGALITFVAFGRQKRIDFLISALAFLLVSFAFGGGMTALWNLAAPPFMYMRNGTAYFDIPIIAAAVITAAVYGGFRLFRRIAERRKPQCRAVVKIRSGGNEVTLDGLADTGNSLRDCFSGKPVVITSLNKAAGVVPEQVAGYFSGAAEGLEGLRLTPCRTVTSDGVIPVFPAEVLINGIPADALVGVVRGELSGADCIFDPNIII